MGRYLSLWEIDESKIPVDPKERGGMVPFYGDN